MAPRIDVTKYPDAVKAMYGLERISRASGTEELKQAGFRLQAQHDFLPRQLFLVYTF